jgi:3-phenylpropionate/cinnamic acid dioxygenase small subunit
MARDVAAELEIRTLIDRVQQMVDMGELDEYLALFTDDAVWTNPGNAALGTPPDERSGKDAIRAGVIERRAAGVQGPGTNTRHFGSTMWVDHDGGDTAVTVSYFQYFTNTDTTPTLRTVGHYRHTVVRTPAGWKVSRRDLFPG